MFNSFFQNDQTDYQDISNKIKSGEAQLVDIREKEEWDQNHFQGAVHIPLSRLAKGVGIDKLKEIKDANKKIFLHCLSGSRVRMAERLLSSFGCTKFNILPTHMSVMIRNGFELTY